MSDFPKLYCPFVRQLFKVPHDHWKKGGARLGLKAPEAYLVVDRINPEFEWVFNDPDTFAVEKLNGSNVKILTQGGRLVAVQNRKNIIDPLQIIKGKTFIMEGIVNAAAKDLIKSDGEQAGELIGPKLQANPYKLDRHEWYPFDLAMTNLRYRSFNEHERTFENLSSWFKDWLFSRYYQKRATKLALDDKVMAEGVVFYNLRRRDEQQSWRAKLRRDMFAWYYQAEGIEIIDYDPKGRDEFVDQEQLD
ncbi:MAG: hypothetical protein HQK54_15375 [Oligoflexales bacterium]|nr:hypothetical protein [Oligoflexales bacterium]